MNWAQQAFPRMPASGSRDDFQPVTLDDDATQKFVEIEVQWNDDDDTTPSVLVRGLEAAEYHQDAARPTLKQLRQARVCATITGGGRIKHDSARRSIVVYGYSMQYGPADLPRVAELCREAYPGYEVTWSKGGY